MITIHVSLKSGRTGVCMVDTFCPISRSCKKDPNNKKSPFLLSEPHAYSKWVSDFPILILSNIGSLSSSNTKQIVRGRRKLFSFLLLLFFFSPPTTPPRP